MNDSSEIQTTSISTTVQNADQNLLLNLLKNAQVSVGHLQGRLISVPGYYGATTFSQFLARVETLYQDTLKPMQDRQSRYNKELESLRRPKKSGELVGEALMFIALFPLSALISAMEFKAPRPEVSQDEEKEILRVLTWREKIDAEFDRLTQQSQNQLDHLATKSCRWKMIKRWDAYLNTKRACENIHINDTTILAHMVKTRQQRTGQMDNIFSSIATLIGDAFSHTQRIFEGGR